MKFLILIIFIIIISVAIYFIYPAINNTSQVEPLNPEQFGLPPTAKEVVSKRTDRTATFSLGENKYAQVSIGGYNLEVEPIPQ